MRVFLGQGGDDGGGGLDVAGCAVDLAGGPDVAPAFSGLLRGAIVALRRGGGGGEIIAGRGQGGFEPGGRGAGDGGADDEVVEAGPDHHGRVRRGGQALLGGDEAGADVDELGAGGHGPGDAMAVGDAAADDDEAIEEGAGGRDEGEGRQEAGMAAGPGADAGEAVDPGGDGLACQAKIDDVGDDQATVALHRRHGRARAAEGGDDHRRAMAGDDLELGGQAVVAGVGDQIDRPGGARHLGGDAGEPGVELVQGAGVGGGEGGHDPGPAGGDDQVRPRDQEHRRGADRDAQAAQEGAVDHCAASTRARAQA